ncbi:segregation and condensation protein B [Luteimonas sp. J16]|jgi:segregation and condensation protein B|nr:segregation and condensation protein B [Luteimonas sp. J16]
MDQQLINRIVEAALLASSQPLTVAQLGGLFPLDEPAPEGSIQAALEALQADCEGRGIELVEVASGWRYQVKADVHPWVARLWTERQTKYTRATLETLALIAYRQPITRGEIEQVRGVATSSNIIKALEEREWVRVVGHRDVPGRPELLGTTKAFLDYFGLKRLDELPPLSELKDFAELEPELEFDGARAVGGIATGDGDDAANDTADAANDGQDGQPAGDGLDGATPGTDGILTEASAGTGEDGSIDTAAGDDAEAADAVDSAGSDGDAPAPATDDDHTPAGGDPAAGQHDAPADDGDGTRSEHE